jgi:hypothetical protein
MIPIELSEGLAGFSCGSAPSATVISQRYVSPALGGYVEGTFVSSVYDKKVGKGKNVTSVQITFWQVKAQSIRKLDRLKGNQATASLPPEAEASDIPY